jgi:hypothetical protein
MYCIESSVYILWLILLYIVQYRSNCFIFRYGIIFADDLSKKFSAACYKFDINVGKILKKLFPKMDISCRIYNGKRGTSYSGVYWKHDASVGGIDMARLAAALPKNTSVTTF